MRPGGASSEGGWNHEWSAITCVLTALVVVSYPDNPMAQ